jgi:hypothetical protein
MEAPQAPAPSASPPDPLKDSPATTLPGNVAGLLDVVRILLGYGRHLIDTVRPRSTAPNFNAIAACFGTANLSTIFAHLNRGILKCLALERILLARAATGRDIDCVQRGSPTMDAPPEPAATAHSLLAERPRAPRPSRPAGWNDPELFMPTLEELERQMRRRPIGRIILDISLDLAVVPTLCHPVFWNALFDIMNWFGGGHAVSQLMTEKTRRREAFAREQDRIRGANWDWVNIPRDALRNVLGFFIGEPPVNPLDPAAAIATAPP